MPKSKQKNQQILDKRKKQIVTCALKVFASKGFTATKISDIARQASMSQGLMYHYFSSKEELFAELIKTAFKSMNRGALELAALEMPPRQKVESAVAGLLRDIENNPDFSRYVLLVAQASISEAVPKEAKELVNSRTQISYMVMEKLFIEGQTAGCVKNYPAREMSILFWTTIKGLAMNKVTLGADYQAPDVRLLLEMFLLPG